MHTLALNRICFAPAVYSPQHIWCFLTHSQTIDSPLWSLGKIGLFSLCFLQGSVSTIVLLRSLPTLMTVLTLCYLFQIRIYGYQKTTY